MKKAKSIKSDNVLCCRGNDLITVIGDLKKPYKPKKKKFNKRFYNKYGRKRYIKIINRIIFNNFYYLN